eukprot:8879349-Pyramimonas_sp.AAC.2
MTRARAGGRRRAREHPHARTKATVEYDQASGRRSDTADDSERSAQPSRRPRRPCTSTPGSTPAGQNVTSQMCRPNASAHVTQTPADKVESFGSGNKP